MSRTVIARRSLLGHVVAAVWGVLTLAARFLSGWPLDGRRRTDAGWLSVGTHAFGDHVPTWWSTRPILARAGLRLAALAVVALVASYPLWPPVARQALGVAVALAVVALVAKGRKKVSESRFQRKYVRPLTAAIREVIADAAVDVDTDFADLSPRLLKDMRPVEVKLRKWYGARLEPVVRYLPERLWRVRAKAAEKSSPFLSQFRRPKEEKAPGVRVRVSNVFVTPEMQKLIGERVAAKLGLSDLTCRWNQVGEVETGVWSVALRPPATATYDHLAQYFRMLAEHEFFVGLGAGDLPVIASLDDDSPHIACSAGSGAGKSVLAQLMAAQTLARGGQVIILDRKGSHRWARGMTPEDGVIYCLQTEQIHNELIRVEEISKLRNARAHEEEDGWDPGPRHLIIFEEMNATIAALTAYWQEVRTKDDPKISPAIAAFRELMFMGRTAKVNLFGVAQMLTARTTGGPEARENFGVRFLARYTRNNWKMLVPECLMPKSSKTRGRWQMVVAGEATAVQVAFGPSAELREFIRTERNREAVPVVPTQPKTRNVQTGSDGTGAPGPDTQSGVTPGIAAEFGPLSVPAAIDEGILPAASYDTWKRRILRARGRADEVEYAPVEVATQGAAKLYDRADLIRFSEWWATKEAAKNGKKDE